MRVTKVEVLSLEFDDVTALHHGQIVLHIRQSGQAGAMRQCHLSCKSNADRDAAHDELVKRLLDDARRQMRWMPEYRLGELSLDVSADAIVSPARTSAA